MGGGAQIDTGGPALVVGQQKVGDRIGPKGDQWLQRHARRGFVFEQFAGQQERGIRSRNGGKLKNRVRHAAQAGVRLGL